MRAKSMVSLRLHQFALTAARAEFARGLAWARGTQLLSGLALARWSCFLPPWAAFCPILKQGWTCSKKTSPWFLIN
ncbi:unnamed protein product [Prunus armeniaca]